MIDFVGKKKIFFTISIILLLPGTISLLVNGLKMGIDFTGGSRLEIGGEKVKAAQTEEIKKKFEETQIEVAQIQKTGDSTFAVRTTPIQQDKANQVLTAIKSQYDDATILRFESVGPTIGAELARNALIALILSWTLIVAYLAYSFRSVPKPTTSLQFGITAIIALIHDALFVIGAFSLLGWLFAIEVDALFVTAILTIVGFSVHDTIVVYDRIRENLIRKKGKTFDETVNIALNETLARSINTSGTVLVVLLALLIFGGETIRWFAFALTLGIFAGAYSSICIAAQLLTVWQNIIVKRNIRQKMLSKDA